MSTCREEASRWVHRYAVGGAAFAALPLPVSTSTGLAALETHLVGVVAEIYGDQVSSVVTATAGGTFAALSPGWKLAVGQLTRLAPKLGPLFRMAVAAGVVELVGQAAIGHFERKHPGKRFAGKLGV
jgi:uncharacterized protein (DUF697 family)